LYFAQEHRMLGSNLAVRVAERVDVLWVEDDALDGELALECLARGLEGLSVRLVSDGREALEWVRACGSRSSLPLVVLLDLHLPGADGLEVLREIRSSPATGLLPVVVFSSAADPRTIEACYRAGANSYVLKPASFAEYLQVLSQVVQYWVRTNHHPLLPF
jgi:two-component system response regulator